MCRAHHGTPISGKNGAKPTFLGTRCNSRMGTPARGTGPTLAARSLELLFSYREHHATPLPSTVKYGHKNSTERSSDCEGRGEHSEQKHDGHGGAAQPPTCELDRRYSRGVIVQGLLQLVASVDVQDVDQPVSARRSQQRYSCRGRSTGAPSWALESRAPGPALPSSGSGATRAGRSLTRLRLGILQAENFRIVSFHFGHLLHEPQLVDPAGEAHRQLGPEIQGNDTKTPAAPRARGRETRRG